MQYNSTSSILFLSGTKVITTTDAEVKSIVFPTLPDTRYKYHSALLESAASLVFVTDQTFQVRGMNLPLLPLLLRGMILQGTCIDIKVSLCAHMLPCEVGVQNGKCPECRESRRRINLCIHESSGLAGAFVFPTTIRTTST
jgi:hypothetical protein